MVVEVVGQVTQTDNAQCSASEMLLGNPKYDGAAEINNGYFLLRWPATQASKTPV